VNGYEQEQEWDAFPPGALPPQHQWPEQQWPEQQWPYQPWQQPAWPAYGPGWSHPSLQWPDGPQRPGSATAAAVLGFVTAGLTLLVCLGNLFLIAVGEADSNAYVLMLGFLTAAGLLTGGVQLLGRRSPAVLYGSAIASVTVLLLAVAAGALTIDRTGGLSGILTFAVMALPLPILTAVFAWKPTVRGWAADPRR
jgi:hypothetical protein